MLKSVLQVAAGKLQVYLLEVLGVGCWLTKSIFLVFKYIWYEEQRGDFDRGKPELMISSQPRDEQWQHVRVDLVKLLLNWKVSFLVTEWETLLCVACSSSSGSYFHLLLFAFAKILTARNYRSLRCENKGVRWIMYHLVRIPRCFVSRPDSAVERDGCSADRVATGGRTLEVSLNFDTSRSSFTLMLTSMFIRIPAAPTEWPFQPSPRFPGSCNPNCPVCPDVIHHTEHQAVYLQAP